MKPGKTSLYLTDRLANLLDAHGPSGAEGERNLGERLGYIVPGWDRVIRDESSRWRAALTREEWFVCQACTISQSFSMADGGDLDLDLGSVLACIEDSAAAEIEIDDAEKWRISTCEKLRSASVAAQLALVWMLIRERNRTAPAGSP